ncbi:MAG: hypothetical protein OHK0052_10040 [Anaerolineales bacterium]
MPQDKENVLNVLKKSHLFIGLKNDVISALAEKFAVTSLKEGQVLFQEGDEAENFYIVYRGAVEIYREIYIDDDQPNKHEHLAILYPGDYFGEEALLTKRNRSACVRALESSILFTLDSEAFHEMLHTNPPVERNLHMIVQSRRLARRLKFDWLIPGEVIYLIQRKDFLFLLTHLIAPIGVILLSLVFFAGALSLGTTFPFYVALSILIIGALWTVWQVIDWSNDYYIVTNERVIWLEKIILLSDSRQEAPLYSILSIGLSSDQIGRILGYGDVNVRTFTGVIMMRDVAHPQQIADLIQEHWDRSKVVQRQEKTEDIRQTIRKRMGLPPTSPPAKPHISVPAPAPTEDAPKQRKMPAIFDDFIKMRYEEGDTITYRKHWIVLILHTGIPFLATLGAAFLLLLNFTGGLNFFLSGTVRLILLLFTFIAALSWFMYTYIDWRNDIYRVTTDQIFDIERKPLGHEEKRAAPLDNILSLEVERATFLGILFNFGSVVADVSGTKFIFRDIYNPAQAQQDIFRRMDARRRKKQADQDAKDTARLAEWLEIYHRESRSQK